MSCPGNKAQESKLMLTVGVCEGGGLETEQKV